MPIGSWLILAHHTHGTPHHVSCEYQSFTLGILFCVEERNVCFNRPDTWKKTWNHGNKSQNQWNQLKIHVKISPQKNFNQNPHLQKKLRRDSQTQARGSTHGGSCKRFWVTPLLQGRIMRMKLDVMHLLHIWEDQKSTCYQENCFNIQWCSGITLFISFHALDQMMLERCNFQPDPAVPE